MPTARLAPKLLTTEEVATLFQVRKRKVQNLVRDAGLPHIRFGRALRFHPEAVARWLAARTEKTPTPGRAVPAAAPPPYDWSRPRS